MLTSRGPVRWLPLVVAAILPITACTWSHPLAITSLAPKVTVCDLYKNAKAMSGRSVRLVAIYTTDRVENSTLTDSHCSKIWITPYDATTNVDRRSLRKFDDAVQGNLSDSGLRVLYVDLIGKYILNSKKSQYGEFYIEKVIQFERLNNMNPWSRQLK